MMKRTMIAQNFETEPCDIEPEEITDDNGESEDEYDSDHSESDPSFSIEEETNSKASRTSIRKKSKKLKEVVDMELMAEADIDLAPNVPILNENDEKDIHEVLSIIKAGKLEKLKVEQCKVYLRKNGLRLTGTKDVLIHRINEHLEILNGGGEKKYPEYSFILNCKGDACMGDVVMFEQKVYEMYNIASRSSIGPSCGTRTVAGRIVKESYGASKQQHTFTIEVLWSKGEKPLPPLHPLLIKGRNLYRMKTMRQTWDDEEKRQKVIMEKHARGSLARSNREARVTEKEKRKVPKENRKSRKEGFSVNPPQSNLPSAGTMLAESMANLFVGNVSVNHQHQQGQGSSLCGNPREPHHQYHQPSENQTMRAKFDPFIDHTRRPFQPQQMMDTLQNKTMQTKSDMFIDHHRRQPFHQVQQMIDTLQNKYLRQPQMKVNTSVSHNVHRNMQQQRCRYFAEGRCYYAENCKFSHEMTQDFDRRDRERLDYHHHGHSHQSDRHCRY